MRTEKWGQRKRGGVEREAGTTLVRFFFLLGYPEIFQTSWPRSWTFLSPSTQPYRASSSTQGFEWDTRGRARIAKARAREKKLLPMSLLRKQIRPHQGFGALLACLDLLSLPKHRGRQGRGEAVREVEGGEREGRRRGDRVERKRDEQTFGFLFCSGATKEGK